MLAARRESHTLMLPGMVPVSATFRLPSTALFLGLMPVFSGLARRADLAATLSPPETKLDSAGRPRPVKVRTYLVHAGRESQTQAALSLFDDDPLWSEGELSALVKRQFGSAGLKHLLGLMIAAEEQVQGAGTPPGSFVFDASQHLDVLGYTRSNRINGKGYHSSKHLREARELVTLLCSLTIVQEIRFGPRRGTTLRLRLLLDEASAEAWEETFTGDGQFKERILTNEKIHLRFNPLLFQAAAEGSREIQYHYTHQLRKLARENARTQGLTLTLGVNLPIQFRLNGCQALKLTARSFLRMAGIAEEMYTRYEQLDRLEAALKHMVEQGYLNSFETERYQFVLRGTVSHRTGKKKQRAERLLKAGASAPADPLEEVWQVTPPGFLIALLKHAALSSQEVRAQLAALAAQAPPRRTQPEPLLPGLEAPGAAPSAAQMLKSVRKALKLRQGELAARLGVTQAAISMAEAGKRPSMAERLLELARRL